jgi:urease accessory protein
MGLPPINLRLLQISDSALPISGYTHSWGLEAAISRGLAHDAASLESWARFWLCESLGPLEGVLAGAACRAGQSGAATGVADLNRLASTTIVPPSTRHASREMGEQLVKLGSTWPWSRSALAPYLQHMNQISEGWHHCVAFGLLGVIAQASPAEVLTAYLHQAILGMIAAGVRAIPLGHTHGQQVLAYLHDDIRELVPALCERDAQTAGTGCPSYEVLCHEQTQLYARMFRS